MKKLSWEKKAQQIIKKMYRAGRGFKTYESYRRPPAPIDLKLACWLMRAWFLRPLMQPLILRHFYQARKVVLSAGFSCLYGHFWAEKVVLHDTFCIDDAPIVIGPGANFSYRNAILTGTHSLKIFSQVECQPVIIGPKVWVTTGCIITPGTVIGEGVVVAPGSVVRGRIPSYTLVSGVPAKVVKKIPKRRQ